LNKEATFLYFSSLKLYPWILHVGVEIAVLSLELLDYQVSPFRCFLKLWVMCVCQKTRTSRRL